ncbi:hypothetical protein B0T13DRAFT_460669 [Neurospora crassa]|nr:hypothetical protein B0T13DRAFT_460669 [Neurospora crassa]
MDVAECHKYGQSKPYRKFECPVCRTDLYYTGCCCKVRPAIIPTNKSTRSIASLLALPKTFLEVSRDAPTARLDQDTTVDGTDVRQDTTDANQDSSDEEKDCPDSDENVADKENDMEDDEIIANYRRNITPAANDNYIERKTVGSPWFSQQGPNGAIRMLTPRPVIYDINSIRQPGFYPVMRLRAQYPDLNNPKGWDCRIVGGRLSDVVDPVCGQCMYDLTRYRWLKHKYDEVEPAWKGYKAYDSTLPDKLPNGDDLPGAGLRQFPGLSWKLAVINAYLCLDSNGRKRQPTWGRWPRELDYMLKQRGWTEGVDFVDWKKAEAMPAVHPKQSEETPRDLGAVSQFLSHLCRFFTMANNEETRDTEGPDAEDPEAMALSVDWNPSQRALDNGLRLCDMEGMGPYPDWDELLEEPSWRAHGISKVPLGPVGPSFRSQGAGSRLG